MAYYPYTLISIIYLSYYQFIQTHADIVNIEGSSYTLSTDIVYAIYQPHQDIHGYLTDAHPEGCSADLFDRGMTDPSVEGAHAKWKIEKTNYGYAIRNVATGRYLSTLCQPEPSENVEEWFDPHKNVYIQNSESPFNEPALSFTFKQNTGGSQTYIDKNSQTLPTVNIIPNVGTPSGPQTGMTSYTWTNWQCAPKLKLTYAISRTPSARVPQCTVPSAWVFLPLSLPLNCKNVTSIPSKPEEFKSLTQQISADYSVDHTNPGSTEQTVATPSKKYCESVTTSFTRTEGSKLTYGFKIAFQQPQLAAAGVSVGGGFSGDYHMDWTKTTETTDTKGKKDDTCIEFPSTEIICPPKTRCTREVATYQPTVSSVKLTVRAICDGTEYRTSGIADVKGIVRIESKDEFIPLDCPYYTRDTTFPSGKLQFCDTCKDDKTCEVCRDNHILLDGVCITEQTCNIACGGEVIEGAAGPWSGGYCKINDLHTYVSIGCRKELNYATPTQTTPDPNDGPSNGEDCVNMYGQCGGIRYNGITKCCQYEKDPKEWNCVKIDEMRSQCNPLPAGKIF